MCVCVQGDSNHHNQLLSHWMSQLSNQPKRMNGSPKLYNNVHPFDSQSLQKLIAENAINGDDYKFISWNDFDVALESDALLFEKLASLNNFVSAENGESNFVPLTNGNPNGNDYFYRLSRGNANNLNKEKMSYQE